MEHSFVYDVETSGLPDWKQPSNHPCQPHVIQLAAIKIADDGTEIQRMNHFIKPDGWTVPDEIVKLTGITQEKLMDEGKPIRGIVEDFTAFWKTSKMRIAHNDSFDSRLMRIEKARLYGRSALLDEWKEFPSFCTMLKSTYILNLPPTEKMLNAGFTKPKPPKLEEAYEFFCGQKPEKCHDAMADVESTKVIYFKIKAGARKFEADKKLTQSGEE